MPKLYRLVDAPGFQTVMDVPNDYLPPVARERKAHQLAEEIGAAAKAEDNRRWLMENFGTDATREPTGDFLTLVDEAAARGKTYGEAYHEVAREYPKLYNEYRAETYI